MELAVRRTGPTGWRPRRPPGLEAVALTDHDTPDGIANVQSAADGRLVVFPGVEVTVGGVHLLCVFDPKATRDDVVSLLAKLGTDPPAFGAQTTSATKGIVDGDG